MIIENPTEEQLRTLTGIIYKITNKVNGKSYVGQTYRTFHKRYIREDWWNCQYMNSEIKKDIIKYTHNSFQVSILETGIDCCKKLDELEGLYIKYFNCIFPNGYNFYESGVGNKQHQIIKDKISNSNAKIYRLKIIETNEIIQIKNLKKFCYDNDLKIKGFYRMFYGYTNRYKIYTLPDINYIPKRKGSTVISVEFPNGDKKIFYSIRSFCREINEPFWIIHRLIIKNNMKTILYNNIKLNISHKIEKKLQNLKIFKSPNGKIFKINNFYKWCRENGFNLEASGFRAIWEGLQKTYFGWTCLNPVKQLGKY